VAAQREELGKRQPLTFKRQGTTLTGAQQETCNELDFHQTHLNMRTKVHDVGIACVWEVQSGDVLNTETWRQGRWIVP